MLPLKDQTDLQFKKTPGWTFVWHPSPAPFSRTRSDQILHLVSRIPAASKVRDQGVPRGGGAITLPAISIYEILRLPTCFQLHKSNVLQQRRICLFCSVRQLIHTLYLSRMKVEGLLSRHALTYRHPPLGLLVEVQCR